MPKNPPESVQQQLRRRLNRHARACWPLVDAVTVNFRAGFAYVAAELPGHESLPLCRLRFTGEPHSWGFALYRADNDGYRDTLLPGGRPAGSPEEALDCAGHLHPGVLLPVVQVPAGLVVLVGPPASGKTSFVPALVEGRQIAKEAVVSSDEIRAELFGASPAHATSDTADAEIFKERDRRIDARLASGRTAVAESTNVTPQARARLVDIARRFDVPVTMLRFDLDVSGLLQQYTERGRTDLAAEDVRTYAAVMAQQARTDQLLSEGATAVHDVPGRRQATSPTQAAARFTFA
ncbi:AAA family ATPase [Streptomyces sp. NPDC085612]|uniref:AAA family ATPase n=1 Tax=Streptomyces sp. NPDC085612 TaxID=3365732 RepID=UPI0037D34395